MNMVFNREEYERHLVCGLTQTVRNLKQDYAVRVTLGNKTLAPEVAELFQELREFAELIDV
jgi:hypothetical protein